MHDDFEAFCFDRAVSEFADFVIAELEKVPGRTDQARKRNAQTRLRMLLSAKEGKKRFADPAKLLKG